MPQSARVEGEEKRIQKKKVQAKEEKETEAKDNKKLKSPTTFLSDGSGIRKNLNLKFWHCTLDKFVVFDGQNPLEPLLCFSECNYCVDFKTGIIKLVTPTVSKWEPFFILSEICSASAG